MASVRFAGAVGSALLLNALPAHACEHCPTTYGAIGPHASFALGARRSIGVGLEVSINRWPDNTKFEAYGAYLNGTYYFTDTRYARVLAGVQANEAPIGAELGLSFLSGSSGAASYPATGGLGAGVFSELVLVYGALRATLPFDGPIQVSIDAGFKYPFVLDGGGWYSPSGRPLRVDGIPRVATPTRVARRTPDARRRARIGPEATDYMAARWLADATNEHAAIFAFLRLACSLAELSAPPALVLRALVAAKEERTHTAGCLALAASYDGLVFELPDRSSHDLSPGKLDVRELVRENWLDGCIGEGLAAENARARSLCASDPHSRRLLRKITREERSHAELGFELITFLVSLDGDAGAVARDELAQLLRHSHAPRYMARDETLRSIEGPAEARLGDMFDRIVARGHDVLRRADRS